MYTQRQRDRRSFGEKKAFPLKTRDGCLVETDRRSTPDRRLGNIHLEVVHIGDHKLPEYLATAVFSTSGKK
jgi:hypothetical protein